MLAGATKLFEYYGEGDRCSWDIVLCAPTNYVRNWFGLIGTKGEVYIILAVDILKLTNIFGN